MSTNTNTNTSEWPKSWDEVRGVAERERESAGDGGHFVNEIGDRWIVFTDGIRGYKGTLYVSVDIGRETAENRDLWVPLDEYIELAIEGRLRPE